MAEHIKSMVAVAFLVASVPVLLLQGNITVTYTHPAEPMKLARQDADKLAKELLALSQKMSAWEEENAVQGAEASSSGGESRRLSSAWTLLLSTDLSSSSLGDFSSGAQVGTLSSSSHSDYRIGKTGAQLQSEGMSGIRVTTNSGFSFESLGTMYPSGFDNTCTTCNCNGQSIGSNFWWHGGRGGCYGSTHFGLKREADVHVQCNDGGAEDSAWGHFHRAHVNTGVYVFGDVCISENEWQERFFFWGRQPSASAGPSSAGASAAAAASTLQRRAVYTRWGSASCPLGSVKLYAGFMATSRYSHSGSGYNMLCMHPSPQLPSGWDVHNNDGALLYGVEYENTGAIDLNHDRDAACVVCQWQNGASVYVEWGNGESRHNPSTPKTCSNTAHEMIYTGLIMSEKYTHWKGENICVDLERAFYGVSGSSTENHNGGLLYTTEMEAGSADEQLYPPNREVGCTVCGIPAKSIDAEGEVTVTPESETSVYTVWGKRTCPSGDSERVYEGFIAGSRYDHGGSGANYICMTTTGAEAPSGYSDGNQDGSLLYGTEYENTGAIDANHDGDAACAVCRSVSHHKDVYVQWGRSNFCSNSHSTVYQGYVMGEKYTHHRSTRLCVHTARETHARSEWTNHNGALLYTTELQMTVSGVAVDHEVGCTSCAGASGKSVFTRWGSRSCPAGSSVLYDGTMMSEHYTHRGGGANTICMHPNMQIPAGSSSGNQNGHLLYKMEYENTGAIDANHNHEAACAVCELDHWEEVYTQWGRSTTCTNGHLTLYTGFIMAERYTHHKGEFICVDSERAVLPNSDGGNQNGGLLYTSEMEEGSADEELYPHNVEVGCSVCVAQVEAQEVPWVKETVVTSSGEEWYLNAIHGDWVKIASVTSGQDVTVSYGYKTAAGTSSSEKDTQQSAQSRAVDLTKCSSSSFSHTFTAETSTSVSAGGPAVKVKATQTKSFAFTSATGSETCGGTTTTEKTSIARDVSRATSWDQSITETRSFSLSIPTQIPAGVPEAETILTLGVDVWQWRWTIFESGREGVSASAFEAKADSKFLFAPVPSGATERRPCCYPGQEYGVLWYPFNCKSSEGLLPGAEDAAHCKVGPPGGSVAEHWSADEVVAWLGTLELSQAYHAVVADRALDGPAIEALVRFVDESPASYSAVRSAFGEIPSGDALKILRGLVELRSAR